MIAGIAKVARSSEHCSTKRTYKAMVGRTYTKPTATSTEGYNRENTTRGNDRIYKGRKASHRYDIK